MTVARRVWLVAALIWLAVACGSLAAPAREPVDAAREAIGAAVALPATSNQLAEVKELRLARQAGRQYTERIAAIASELRERTAQFRAEHGIRRGVAPDGSILGGTVATAQVDIDGMATSVLAGGSTRSRPPTATNEGAGDRYQSGQKHGSTMNHAEQRLLSELASKIMQALGLDPSSRAPKPSVTGRIQMFVEQEPCSACKSGLRNLAARNGVIKQFSREFPNVQLVVTNNRQDEVSFVHNATTVRFKPTAARVPVLASPRADTASTGSAVDPGVGGVDFSSLELRYLSDVSTDKTDATGFAFKASPAKGERGDGLRAAERASDAFFVWLALPTDAMWVNLNPTEPDSIIDPRLGRTNAGRVLLEADLRMKRLSARLTHPNTRLGRRYWSELAGIQAEGARCSATRMWIVPARATVRETADELYIVKAPLRVRLQTDLSGTLRCNAGPRYAERVNDLDRRLILPRVQRAVRRAPEFAALRSVYMSRIAAEWYRERKQDDGAFADIIDSGNVSDWAPPRSWTPQSLFRRYVRSFEDGEYKVRQRVVRGGRLYTRTISAGGVDFGSVPRDKVDAQELATLRPGLAQRLSRAIARPAADPQLGEVWLAGTTFDRKAAVEDPEFDEPLGGGGDDDAATGPVTVAMIAFVIVAVLASFVGFVVRRRRPG